MSPILHFSLNLKSTSLLYCQLALWGLMVRRAGRPVLRLAIGRDLAPSLRDAGLYELLYSLSLTGALVALVALV